jgi:hypothetical protein
MKKLFFIVGVFIVILFGIVFLKSKVPVDTGIINVKSDFPIKFIIRNTYSYQTTHKLKFMYLFDSNFKIIHVDSNEKFYAIKSYKNYFREPLVVTNNFSFVIEDDYFNNTKRPYYQYERLRMKLDDEVVEYTYVIIDTQPILYKNSFRNTFYKIKNLKEDK